MKRVIATRCAPGPRGRPAGVGSWDENRDAPGLRFREVRHGGRCPRGQYGAALEEARGCLDLLLRITPSQELPDEARTRLEEAREHVDRVSGNGGPLEDRLKIASDADILAAAETVWKFISAILWNYPVR